MESSTLVPVDLAKSATDPDKSLDFENAIKCRDKIKRIEKELQKDESK